MRLLRKESFHYLYTKTAPAVDRRMMRTSTSMEPVLTSEAVVERIANREGVDPLELSPLYEAIDPDALDSLTTPGGESGSRLQIEFSYHGYELRVTGEGVIHIEEHAVPAAPNV